MRSRVTQYFLTALLLGMQSSYAAIPLMSAASVPPAQPAKPANFFTVSCAPIKIKAQNSIIMLDGNTSGSSQIYLIKNHSQKSIWLDHPSKRTTASAGWSSYLRPNEWSAVLIDKKGFALSCAVIEPGKVENLDCEAALTVCRPPHLVYNPSRKGSFWLVEGKTWKEMVKALEKRGVKD